MRILIPTSSYPLRHHSGWAPFLKETFSALAGEGHDIQVLVFNPENALLEYQEDSGVRVRAYPFLPWGKSRLHQFSGLLPSLKRSWLAWLELPFYFVSSAVQIMCANARGSFDIIHAPWYFPMGFIACVLKPFHRKPVVVTGLGGDFHLPVFLSPLLRFTFRMADANVVCSHYLAEKASVYGLPPSGFTIIPNGIRAGLFHSPRSSSRANSKITVGCAKRLVPEKNISDLIHAIRKLPDELLPNLAVKIAGSGPEEVSLRRLIARLNLDRVVSLAGFIPPDEMPGFLRGVDIFVDPSTQEGLATSNLEALAAGCTLVAADTAGNPEIITSGDSGFLYPARNIEALSAVLLRLCLNPDLRKQAGSRGQILVSSQFDVSQIAKKISALYSILPNLKRPAAASQTNLSPSSTV